MTAPILRFLFVAGAIAGAFYSGYRYGGYDTAKWLWRPDPSGYVICDFDGSVHAGNIHIVDGLTVDEFQDGLSRMCLHKRRVKPL